MHKGIETFVQPGRKLHRRAEEALMKLTSRRYCQIPLEPVDESEALKASETPPANVEKNNEEKKVQNTGNGIHDLTLAVEKSKGSFTTVSE